MSQSPRLESLFAAARDDAPSRAVQDGVWARVAAKTVATAGAGAAGAAGAAATTGAKAAGAALLPPAAKLLVVGAALGATVAGASFVVLGPAGPPRSASPPVVSANAARPTHAAASRGRDDPPPAFELPPATESLPSSASPSPSASASAPPPVAAVGSLRPATVAAEDPSALAEEARLVTEARRALVSGDPERALVWIRRTRGLSTRALEPEELALEARALRALGRTDEARATDEALRRRFPGHALAH
jgi:hypothetical protein